MAQNPPNDNPQPFFPSLMLHTHTALLKKKIQEKAGNWKFYNQDLEKQLEVVIWGSFPIPSPVPSHRSCGRNAAHPPGTLPVCGCLLKEKQSSRTWGKVPFSPPWLREFLALSHLGSCVWMSGSMDCLPWGSRFPLPAEPTWCLKECFGGCFKTKMIQWSWAALEG